jgi:hypothetical protein
VTSVAKAPMIAAGTVIARTVIMLWIIGHTSPLAYTWLASTTKG